jgi:hypothetical protein
LDFGVESWTQAERERERERERASAQILFDGSENFCFLATESQSEGRNHKYDKQPQTIASP